MCLKYLQKIALSVLIRITLSAGGIKGYQDCGMWVITGFQGGVKENSRKQVGKVGITRYCKVLQRYCKVLQRYYKVLKGIARYCKGITRYCKGIARYCKGGYYRLFADWPNANQSALGALPWEHFEELLHIFGRK